MTRCLISPYCNTAESFIQIMRIKEIMLGCKGLRLTGIKETTEKMSLKKLARNWDLHKCPSATT